MINLTAIILTCDRSARCLDSAWHNTLAMKGLAAETIVINNGAQCVSLPSMISGIPCRVIQMPRNIGIAARNVGIRAAAGEFLLIMDDDSYIDPGLAEKMITAFKLNPAMAAVSFRIRNGAGEEGCLLPTVFHGCACGFRKTALLKVGCYPASYLYYGEEYDVAFKLYAEGYSIGIHTGLQRVRHERDGAGRNHARIIRLLVRNNISFLLTHFPFRFLASAIRDVMQRYKLVAAKEDVPHAYRQGVASLPAAILNGILHRNPLSEELFKKAVMLDKMQVSCQRLLQSGATEVIICGTGKFPSLWLEAIELSGLQVKAILDTNICWNGQAIRNIPVITRDTDIDSWLGSGLPCLTGTASLPENQGWRERLEKEHGYVPGPQGSAALSSQGGIFDLSDFCQIIDWRPREKVFRPMTHNGICSAYPYDSDGLIKSHTEIYENV